MNIINMIINIVLMVVIYWNIYTCFSRYIDYKNTDKDFYDIKYNKMEYHKSLRKDDIKRFISNIENVKVGTKTTNTTLTCLTGFEVHGQAACVKPENFDLNVGANYAQIKAEDKIWEGLGFVLQWAKYGLKR